MLPACARAFVKDFEFFLNFELACRENKFNFLVYFTSFHVRFCITKEHRNTFFIMEHFKK